MSASVTTDSADKNCQGPFGRRGGPISQHTESKLTIVHQFSFFMPVKKIKDKIKNSIELPRNMLPSPLECNTQINPT